MTVRRSWAGGTEDLRDWGEADFSPKALEIYDLNGEPLFYEFGVLGRGGEIGRIKTAASRLVGTGVVAVEQGERRWDPETAIKMALNRAKELYPRNTAEAKEFVCYCYPKIGIRVELYNSKGREKGSVIFDVSDGSQVTEFGDEGIEGQMAYSFLDSLDAQEGHARMSRYDVEDKELEAARERTPRLFDRDLGKDEIQKLKVEFTLQSSYALIPFYSSRVLKYGPRCTPHDCFELYAQQTNVYCAVATGQMILDFYRRYFDQTAIAAAMGTGASGTSNSGQVAGYESLSNGCLDATYDGSADWAEAKAEIDANRPVKSGIPGHARVCTGWKRQNFWLFGTQPKKWLRIHDPWPWNSNICNGGAVYWEDWDSVTHTNFIYVRHATTSH
ncbi:C39 family peptidase [Sedimentitalea sp. JM2-8]|uniref:C39 family peptidase n=2 Tax=Sedimentitalea xiamensis TaxID=3050037 RepID=A0ABT7FAJ0_9RHOB|nr:C39 family peptidase [Sedimentitalea xiamensis]